MNEDEKWQPPELKKKEWQPFFKGEREARRHINIMAPVIRPIILDMLRKYEITLSQTIFKLENALEQGGPREKMKAYVSATQSRGKLGKILDELHGGWTVQNNDYHAYPLLPQFGPEKINGLLEKIELQLDAKSEMLRRELEEYEQMRESGFSHSKMPCHSTHAENFSVSTLQSTAMLAMDIRSKLDPEFAKTYPQIKFQIILNPPSGMELQPCELERPRAESPEDFSFPIFLPALAPI